MAAGIAWCVPSERRDARGVESRSRAEGLAAYIGSMLSGDVVEVSVSWTKDEDLEDRLGLVAQGAVDWLTLSSGNRDAWEEFDIWAETLASDDSEFGRDIARCVASHERELTVRCAWDHEIVVRRNDDDAGEVVHVNTVFRNAREAASEPCRAYAACVRNAWQERSAPPVPDTENPYVALRALGVPATVVWRRSGLPHREYYLSQMRELEAGVAERSKLEPGGEPSHAHQHNLRQDLALLAHMRVVVEIMKGANGD